MANRVDFFQLATQRLSWLERRQQVLAQNVANADTPGYRPRDLPDFARALMQSAGSGIRLAATNPGHLDGSLLMDASAVRAAAREGVAPDGNAVSLQQELVKVADTGSSQELVTRLFRTYVGLFQTALGKG